MSKLDTAARFLGLLDEVDEFTFQTFPESRAGPQGPAARVLHGSFDQYADELARLNAQGAGIFVMVNQGDGTIHEGSKTCRTAANVVRVRALFVDLDGAPVEPVLSSSLPPDWVVASSPGRWHAYWEVPDCALDAFGRHQAALAARFGGDPSVIDLPRVMRIPGFLHHKGEPYLAELYMPAQYEQLAEQSHAC